MQQAMEENMLCPFHYFGITDVSLLGDKEIKSKKLTESSFNQLVGDERGKAYHRAGQLFLDIAVTG